MKQTCYVGPLYTIIYQLILYLSIAYICTDSLFVYFSLSIQIIKHSSFSLVSLPMWFRYRRRISLRPTCCQAEGCHRGVPEADIPLVSESPAGCTNMGDDQDLPPHQPQHRGDQGALQTISWQDQGPTCLHQPDPPLDQAVPLREEPS